MKTHEIFKQTQERIKQHEQDQLKSIKQEDDYWNEYASRKKMYAAAIRYGLADDYEFLKDEAEVFYKLYVAYKEQYLILDQLISELKLKLEILGN